MNPRQPDLAVVERRRRALSDALDDLNRLHDVDADGFRADPIVRAAAERLLQVSVDLAVDIDVHLVTRAVADILDLMPRYIGEVATFLRSS